MGDLADLYPGYASPGLGALGRHAGMDTLAAWAWAADLRGFAIDSGHYLAEENPQATATALLDLFAEQ